MQTRGWERACSYTNITLTSEYLICLWLPRKFAFNPCPMSDLKSSDSPQVKFVHEWNQAVRNGDLDFLAKSIPKDYRNTFYPRSLGVPDQTKEEFLEYIGGFFNLWTEWEVSYISCYWSPLSVAESLS